MWNKTIFNKDEEAAKIVNKRVSECIEEYPDDEYFKNIEGKVEAYTYRDYCSFMTNKERETVRNIKKAFVDGWDWYPETTEGKKPEVIYGQVYLCENAYEDYYVVTTDEGWKFLKENFSKLLNISLEDIDDINWCSENSDNIEDVCDFLIFLKDDKIINYWTYIPFETWLPVCMVSEEAIKEFNSEVTND